MHETLLAAASAVACVGPASLWLLTSIMEIRNAASDNAVARSASRQRFALLSGAAAALVGLGIAFQSTAPVP